jgi:hypothetical protein
MKGTTMKKLLIATLICFSMTHYLAAMQEKGDFEKNTQVFHNDIINIETLDHTIITMGDCALTHQLTIQSTGKIVITPNSRLFVSGNISGLGAHNLQLEDASSVIIIYGNVVFDFVENCDFTIGTISVLRQSSLMLSSRSLLHSPTVSFGTNFAVALERNALLTLGGNVLLHYE